MLPKQGEGVTGTCAGESVTIAFSSDPPRKRCCTFDRMGNFLSTGAQRGYSQTARLVNKFLSMSLENA